MNVQTPARRGLRGMTLAVLAAVAALLAGACSVPEPPALVRQDAPPNAVTDPAQPCSRTASDAPAEQQSGARPGFRFDRPTNTIEINSGEGVTLPSLARAVNDPEALREVAPGEWLLAANVVVQAGASLHIAAPTVHWLKLRSSGPQFASIKAFGGSIDITGACVTSWDDAQGRADTEYTDGRGFLLARDGATMTVDRAELRYLGYGEVESYGLAWRTEGTTGKITNSVVSHLYYGLYSFEVGGLVVQNNEFHDNVLYGVDPHTHSHDMVIEGNRVHHNGKHGIILAEDCTDSVIRNNVVYANQHHGIVLYLRSDRNVIEDNDTFGNAAQGINVNESSANTVRNNRVYDNGESGIGVAQTAADNVVEQNQIRGNKQDGIRVVSEATQSTLRGNVIGENLRYGVYVDSDGAVDMAENTIFGSRAGVMLRSSSVAVGDNQVYDNQDADILNG